MSTALARKGLPDDGVAATNILGYDPNTAYLPVDAGTVNAFNFNYVASFPIAIGLDYPENAGVRLSLDLYYNSHVAYWQNVPCYRSRLLRVRRENPFGLGFDLHFGRIVYKPNTSLCVGGVVPAHGWYAYVAPDGALHILHFERDVPEGQEWLSKDGSDLRAVKVQQGWIVYQPNGEVHELFHEVAAPAKEDLGYQPCCHFDGQENPLPEPGSELCPSPVGGEVTYESPQLVVRNPAAPADPNDTNDPLYPRWNEWRNAHDRDFVGWHATRVYSQLSTEANPTSYAIDYFQDAARRHLISSISDRHGRSITFEATLKQNPDDWVITKIRVPRPAETCGSSANPAEYTLTYDQKTVVALGASVPVWTLSSLSGPPVPLSPSGQGSYTHEFEYSEPLPAPVNDTGGRMSSIRYPSGRLVRLSYQENPYTTYERFDCGSSPIKRSMRRSWGVSSIETFLDGDPQNSAPSNRLITTFSQAKATDSTHVWANTCGENSAPPYERWYDQIHTMIDWAGNATELRFRTADKPTDQTDDPFYSLLEQERYFGGDVVKKQVDHTHEVLSADTCPEEWDVVVNSTTTTFSDDRRADGSPLSAATKLIETHSEFDRCGQPQRIVWSGNSVGPIEKIVTRDYANDDEACWYYPTIRDKNLCFVLKTEETRQDVNNQTPVSRTDYEFDVQTGRMLKTIERIEPTLGTPSCDLAPAAVAGDVVSTFDYGVSGSGDVMHVERFIQGATGPSSVVFKSDFTYSHGTRATSKESTLPFYEFVRVIDPATGLVCEERSGAASLTDTTTAVVAKAEYDVLGRKVSLRVGSEWPTIVSFENEGAGGKAMLKRVKVSQASGDDRTESVDHFAGGRLVREDRLLPDGSFGYRHTKYDYSSRVMFVSEWTDNPSPAGAVGTYTDYTVIEPARIFQEPFGRPTVVFGPLGETTEYKYFGTNRTVTRRGIAGVSTTGSPIAIDVPTHYYTDGLGRLRVVEQGAATTDAYPSTPASTPRKEASYAYDIHGRLTDVVLADAVLFDHSDDTFDRFDNYTSGATQARTFDFDALGRLSSSTTPEGGTVTTLAWNALGDPVEVQDALGAARGHAHRTTYDAAGRPTLVERIVKAGGILGSLHVAGATDWSMFGVWNHNPSGQCVGAASWYIGASDCRYARGSAVSAALISPSIGPIPSGTMLSFKFFREVRQQASSDDRFTVTVAEDAGTIDWEGSHPFTTVVFYADSSDISWSRWQRSPAIDLSKWAGKSIKVRFHFNSVSRNFSLARGIAISEVAVRRPESVKIAETFYDQTFGYSGNRVFGKPTTLISYDESTLAPAFTRQVSYFNDAGRATNEAFTFDWDRSGGGTSLHSWTTYNSRGAVSGESHPHELLDGGGYEYAYRRGALVGMTRSRASQPHILRDEGSIVPGISYDKSGQPSKYRLGNGLQQHVDRNAAYLPSRFRVDRPGTGVNLFDTGVYSYDGSRNIQSIGAVDQFRYDSENRLTWARVASSNPAYGTIDMDQVYDGYGNMIDQKTSQNGGAPTALGPPGLHFTGRTHTDNRISTAGFEHDANGNLITEPAHDGVLGNLSYVFSPENRLHLVRSATGQTGRILQESLYDSDGNRWAKITNAGALITLRSSNGKLSTDFLESTATSGLQKQKDYLRADGQIVGAVSYCGPRPALELASPPTQNGQVCFIRTDYAPAVQNSTLHIQAGDGAWKTLSSNYAASFCVPQTEFYANQSNFVRIQTDTACGQTGYSNAVSYYFTTASPPPVGASCITSWGVSRTPDAGDGSPGIKLSAEGSCEQGTSFNSYYRAPGASEGVQINEFGMLSTPHLTIGNSPCGAGLGQYWFRAVAPTGIEGPNSAELIINETGCEGPPDDEEIGGSGPSFGQPSVNYQWFHWDHLGNTRMVTDELGIPIASFKYYPFGLEAETTGGSGVRPRYTGHERDETLGFDYMLARYYSSSLSRFLSIDPGEDTYLDAPQSWNKFSYVRNNPVNANDPDGRFWNVVIGAAIGGAVEYGSQVWSNYQAGHGASSWSMVNGSKIMTSMAVGGATSGLSAIKGLSVGTKILIGAAGNLVEADQHAKADGERLSPEAMLTSMAAGGIANGVAEVAAESGKAAAQASKAGAELRHKAKRLQNIADSGRPRPAQTERAAEAAKAAADYGSGKVADTATKAVEKAVEQILEEKQP